MSKHENIKNILKKIEEHSDPGAQSKQIDEGIIGDLLAKFKSPEEITAKHRAVITKYWKKRSVAQAKMLEKQAMLGKRVIAKLNDPKQNPGLYKQIIEIVNNYMSEVQLLLGFIYNWEKLEVPSKLTSTEKKDLRDAADEEGYEGEEEGGEEERLNRLRDKIRARHMRRW